MRIVEVSLDGTDGETIIEGGQDVVEADARGDSIAPAAGLEDGASDLGSAEEGVGEGNEAVLGIADDRPSLGGVDAVVGTVGEEAALGLQTEVTVEVAG